MIGLLASQVLAVAAVALLVWLPGWAVARLLQLQLYVPVLLLPVAWFAFGLGLWTAAFVATLALHAPIAVTLAVHGAVTLVLVVVAWLRDARRGHAKRQEDAVSTWTVGAIAAAVLLAAVLRTRIAFDTLFHIGVSRRLLELHEPTFATIDRIAGAGVNPSYVIPTWQALFAGASKLTGLDPATVMEANAAFAVLLAACAAGALGRVITGTAAGEMAAAAAYAWLRVFFPRRELEGDGVAYAALPGNVAIDVLLAFVLVVAVLVVQRGRDRSGRGALAATGAVGIALVVVLHANYVVYLAVIGIGAALWLALAGPWGPEVRGGLVRALLAIAVPGVIAFACLLPVLTMLDQFGSPLEQRIDYHLMGHGAWQITRPGHLYDWFAAPGLLAMLLLPWAAWRGRGVGRAVVAGGAITLMACALVPPLLHLLGSSGSLTLALRIPRPMGILLAGGMAIALPDLLARIGATAGRVRTRWGGLAARAAWVAPFAVVVALSAAYGYPLARRTPPQYGWNWPTLVAVAGLLLVLVLAVRDRRRGRGDGALDEVTPAAAAAAPALTAARPSSVGAALPNTVPSARALGLALLALGACFLPSGYDSLRRGAWQSRQLVASARADDLGCTAGIQHALERLPSGDTLVSDPMTAYTVQAVAPVYIAADFKTWNGATDTSRSARRIHLLEDAFDSRSEATAVHAVERMRDTLDARWLVVARGEVEAPLGAKVGNFDAVGLRHALDDGSLPARRVAAGEGHIPGKERTTTSRAACSLELWQLRDGSGDPR
ncbi:MAG: hypothetical protein JWM98_2748 [Thermoleophilia bacterium]|nr:hypothetical protein [Thermoleophilia bacterium]